MKPKRINPLRGRPILYIFLLFGLLLHVDINAQCPTDPDYFSNQDSINNFPTNYPNCTEWDGYIFIEFGDITTLDSLIQLTSITGSLYFGDLCNLTSLSGLDSLKTLGSFSLFQAESLTSLAGLNSLENITGNVEWCCTSSLLNLTGLESLESIGGTFSMSLGSLTDISALSSLTTIGEDLIINDELDLTSLNGLQNVSSIGRDVSITNNDGLMDLSNFPNISAVSRDLIITHNDLLTDLTGLEHIDSVGFQLIIEDNDELSTVSGLDNLVYLGAGLKILDNLKLENLQGLSSLNFVSEPDAGIDGFTTISNNPLLNDLTGLEGITEFGERLSITGNSGLTSLLGLQNLESVPNESFWITNNDALLDLDGLSSLNLTSGLVIQFNDNLQSINGLSSLTDLNSASIVIINNPQLDSLTGLEGLDISTLGSFEATGNGSLSYCHVQTICDYVNGNNNVTIDNNAVGCNSIPEVQDSCLINCAFTVSASATPDTICDNESSTLTATPSNQTDPVTYEWNPGGLVGQSVVVNPNMTTTYTVTATDDAGCTDTAEVTVTVEPTPNPVITGDNTFCEGDSSVLDAGVYPQHSWSTGETTQTITVYTTGDYTVTVTESNGCTGSDVISISVLDNPTVTVSANPNPVCLGDSSTVSAVASGGQAPFTYNWNQGLGAGDSHVVSPTSTTTYTVTITDNNGCEVIDSVTLTVNPIPDVAATATPDTICLGESSDLLATGSGGTEPYSYNWDQGLGAGDSHNVTPIATTTYNVTLTDDYGCIDTTEITVEVLTLPMVAANANPQTICEGDTSTISAVGSDGTPPYMYEWDQGLGVGASHDVTPETTTIYSVTITDDNGCTTRIK